ncbi:MULTISPECIES: class II aldolase/adducin family protein [Dictyoglomus]|jgi:L-fuculose-phosphate aldolase|uniref:3-oxo-tetronate 4-phosphate decarboxylase n=1 Tax=Dictyoglomus turgidum (strain DSM 6724 / Z-1310) TaxID=515635 RepID=B8E1U4_DICTD|nr:MULTISPECIES: class II aldolase/adducin family protein [Dictyoglomus]ACK41727.1 class II aldolase/adducin family protein [Dictyoglomus turgidum DSM 6724]PNV79602.1 MAG: class II aldolase family protein [Dictyoglomus turgidum]HBU31777.1 class II aldolase/adducin family protein [Dictyoglomus sp.]
MNSEIEKVKRELVKIGKRIAQENLIVGPGGNISAKVGNRVYIKASGISFEDATEDDYIGVDFNSGEVIEGDKKPSSEIWMHLECYKVREDVKAVVHTHPIYSIAYAFQDEPLKLFTPDMVALLGGEIPVVEYVVPGGKEFAGVVGGVIKNHNGVLVKNHGLVTVGSNLKEALYRTLLIENSIKTIFVAKLFGKMGFFTKEQIEEIDSLEVEKYRRKLLKEKG